MLIPGISLVPLIIAAQIANGLLLPIILVFIMKLANDRGIMGPDVNRRPGRILGWAVAGGAGALSVAYIVVSLAGIGG